MAKTPLVLDAHGKHAQAVHFTRDKKRLVSSGQDARVRVWSVPGFSAEGAFVGHARCVNGLSFTADETRLATGSSDPAVRVWSFPEGRSLLELEKQSSGCIGPDGQHLATISAKGELVLWDATSGQKLKSLPVLDKRYTTLAFAPNGVFLFVGGTGPIHRIALPDGTSDGVQLGHEIGVACLRNSPNGSILASSGLDGTLRFWTIVGGAEVSRVPIGCAGCYQLAFAPDGRTIALGVDHAVLLLTVPDGQLIEKIELPVKGVYGVAISPDGRWLANAAADGRVRVWDIL